MQDNSQSNVFGTTTAPAAPPPVGNSPSAVIPTISDSPKGNSGGKKILGALLGLVVLIGGVGAGILLVKQQQDIRSKAAVVSDINAKLIVTDAHKSACTNSCQDKSSCVLYVNRYHCDQNNASGGCQSNGTTLTNAAGVGTGYGFDTGKTCGTQQIDLGCKDNLGTYGNVDFLSYFAPTSCGGGGSTPAPGGSCVNDFCTGPNDCVGGTTGANGPRPGGGNCSPGLVMCCVGGGGGGGGPAPTPTPRKAVCGETCSVDSDCFSQGTNGAAVGCRNGTCQNLSCVGKTEPGTICACNSLNACGQPCGSDVGLCQSGSTCRYINGPNCAISSSNNRTTYCVPDSPSTGSWQTIKCVARDTGNSYVLNNGQNPTVSQVQQACLPATPVPSPTPNDQILARCLNIKIFDTGWNQISANNLTQLKAGDKVRFTVAGSKSGTGAFDFARFIINGITSDQTNLVRPGTETTATPEFYYEYTIPAGVTNFTINAQLHHTTLGWF